MELSLFSLRYQDRQCRGARWTPLIGHHDAGRNQEIPALVIREAYDLGLREFGEN
jgi:hypothetical protein